MTTVEGNENANKGDNERVAQLLAVHVEIRGNCRRAEGEGGIQPRKGRGG